MSDTEKAPTGASSQFTERETQILAWAMQSLKSGPPEIDFEKLAAFAGMSNKGSASNAWSRIKSRLVDGTGIPMTPSKSRKRATKANVNGDGESTPKMTPTSRKRAPKRQDVDGDASPQKKARSKYAAKVDSEEGEGEGEDGFAAKTKTQPLKLDPDELADDEI